MKFYQTILKWTAGIILVVLLGGCQNSDSLSKSSIPKNDARLAGTWRQIRLDKQNVSDRNIKLIITARSLTMQASGCQISGEYTTAGDQITFKITAAEGEQCAKGQQTGQSDSAHYRVTDSQLVLTNESGGMKIQTVFRRADGKQQS